MPDAVMKYLLKIVLLSLISVPASYSADVVEVARTRIPIEMTAVPTRAGWMLSSPKRIKVLTPDQHLLYSRRIKSNQRLLYSEGGEHFGVIKYNDHSPTTFSVLRVEVFDNAGKPLWTIEKPEASSFVLSAHTSRAIGIVGAEGLPRSRLQIYSAAGKQENSLAASFLFGVRFSRDGSRVFVNSADSGLAAYDLSGNLVGRFGSARKFGFSDDGTHVAVSNAGRVVYFRDGVKIKTVASESDNPVPVLRMQFDSDERHMAVLRGNGVSAYRLPTLELVWEERDRTGSRKFTSFDCSVDGLMAVAYDIPSKEGGKIAHTEGGVMLFDSTGKRLWHFELDYSRWAREFPMVCFTRDGKGLQIATAEEAYFFEISR
jgi:hypothetical protein